LHPPEGVLDDGGSLASTEDQAGAYPLAGAPGSCRGGAVSRRGGHRVPWNFGGASRHGLAASRLCGFAASPTVMRLPENGSANVGPCGTVWWRQEDRRVRDKLHLTGPQDFHELPPDPLSHLGDYGVSEGGIGVTPVQPIG
jgi:hypothetical protein